MRVRRKRMKLHEMKAENEEVKISIEPAAKTLQLSLVYQTNACSKSVTSLAVILAPLSRYVSD